MMNSRFQTNLRCEGCVAAIRPGLDAAFGPEGWSVDIESAEKPLTVIGLRDPQLRDRLTQLLQPYGYTLLRELPAEVPAAQEAAPPPAKTTYFPLLLILLYLLGVCGAVEIAAGSFQPMRAMAHFMSGFFLVFSFFKLLNLTAFADAYAGYDLLAARWRFYGYAYPFIELGLGVAYLLHLHPFTVNIVTLIVMLVSTVGVVQALLSQRTIRCACLGAVFNLPMSSVTLIEDLLMVVMAAGMLIAEL